MTRPAASSSRNFAGKISRPFSSRRGVWVPRNMPFRTSSLHQPPYFLHFPPLYSTSLHLGSDPTPGLFGQPPGFVDCNCGPAGYRFPTTVGFRGTLLATGPRSPTTVGFRGTQPTYGPGAP